MFKAVALITVFSVISRALGFVYKIILSRTVSTQMLGAYSIAISVFIVIITIFNSGIPLAISKITVINTVNNNKRKINGSVLAALVLSLSACFFIIASLLLGKNILTHLFGNIDSYTLLLILIPALIASALYAPFKGFLWGKEEYFKVSIVEFIEEILKVLMLGLCAFVFIGSDSILPAGLSLSVAGILSSILGIFYYFRIGGRLSSPREQMKEVFTVSSPITGVRVASSVMQSIISIILPLRLISFGLTNAQALSELGITMGMTFPLLTIPATLIGSLATVLIPRLTGLMNTKNTQGLKNQMDGAINFTLCCSFMVIPCFIAIGIPACDFVFGNSLAGQYLVYASWIVVPMCLQLISSASLNSLGEEKRCFIYNIISSTFMLASAWILPKYIGIYALTISIGLSSTIVSILALIRINKVIGLNKRKHILSFLTLVLIMVPVTLLTKYVYNLTETIFPSIVSMIVAGIISIVSFAILLSCFNVIDISIIKGKISRKKKALRMNK